MINSGRSAIGTSRLARLGALRLGLCAEPPRRVASIRYAHKLAHLDTPTDSEAVKATLRGIRRTAGAAKVRTGCGRQGAGNGCAGSSGP